MKKILRVSFSILLLMVLQFDNCIHAHDENCGIPEINCNHNCSNSHTRVHKLI